jgi:regulator of protease activity HflC (stomatin/prohibitin superfamily)
MAAAETAPVEEPGPPANVSPAPPTATAPEQLTQTQIALSDALAAFGVPDDSGRQPIVLTVSRAPLRPQLLLAALVAFVPAAIFDLTAAQRTVLFATAIVLGLLGLMRWLRIRVPQGSQAILMRQSRYHRILGPGAHTLPPWIAITYLVTTRVIPFEVVARGVPTADGVRTDLDLILVFAIEDPRKFVFEVAAPDFDRLSQGAALEAVRKLVRGLDSTVILDLAGSASADLQSAIGEVLRPYGVAIRAALVTQVRLPDYLMRSIESRRLTASRRAEQDERHALETRRQSDRVALERQLAEAQRGAIELDASNEALRLRRLEERIVAYPAAAEHDIEERRLDVSRALAGNSRTLLHVGDPGGVLEDLVPTGRPGHVSNGEAGAVQRPTPSPIPDKERTGSSRASKEK